MSITPDAPPSVAATIAGRGYPITLATGETVRVRYSMLSLERLEQQYGDLAGIITHVEGAAAALGAREKARKLASGATDAEPLTETEQRLVDTNSSAAVFTAVVSVLLPGLLDAKATDPRDPDAGPVWLEGRDDVAKRVLDPGQLSAYLDAFRSAFTESFGDTGGDAVPPQGLTVTLPPQAVTPPLVPPHSPGPIGTTSPAGSPGAQMSSSGA